MNQEWKRVDQVDASRRDGRLRLHDTSRTFAQNVVSYLRHAEAYVEGRPFPTGMMLVGTAPDPVGFRIVAVVVTSLFRFENSSTEELFGCMPPEADRFYCVPMMNTPKTDAESKRAVEELLKHNDMGRVLFYLHVNGWWVSRLSATTEGPAVIGCTPINHVEMEQPLAVVTCSMDPGIAGGKMARIIHAKGLV